MPFLTNKRHRFSGQASKSQTDEKVELEGDVATKESLTMDIDPLSTPSDKRPKRKLLLTAPHKNTFASKVIHHVKLSIQSTVERVPSIPDFFFEGGW